MCYAINNLIRLIVVQYAQDEDAEPMVLVLLLLPLLILLHDVHGDDVFAASLFACSHIACCSLSFYACALSAPSFSVYPEMQ